MDNMTLYEKIKTKSPEELAELFAAREIALTDIIFRQVERTLREKRRGLPLTSRIPYMTKPPTPLKNSTATFAPAATNYASAAATTSSPTRALATAAAGRTWGTEL